MIRSVFIIHESGLCLLSRSYSGDSQNRDLFSGFLVAVSSFAKNLIGEKINEIRMEHHKIFYESRKALVIALVTSEKKISNRKLSTIMKRIYNNFIEQYNDYLEHNIIEPEIFRDFSTTIDNILQTSGITILDYKQAEKTITGVH
ncbi:MAG: hypothetical protein ACFFC6_01450 [Promethearchaeota archaeon]